MVADSGNHRVLIWHGIPSDDEQPADVVLGQPDGETEGRAAGGRGQLRARGCLLFFVRLLRNTHATLEKVLGGGELISWGFIVIAAVVWSCDGAVVSTTSAYAPS